jgi:hypothetical protein
MLSFFYYFTYISVWFRCSIRHSLTISCYCEYINVHDDDGNDGDEWSLVYILSYLQAWLDDPNYNARLIKWYVTLKKATSNTH